MSAPFQVELSGDRARLVMRSGVWCLEVPAADLPRWLAFYRRLRDRKKSRYTRHYAECVGQLEQAAAELGLHEDAGRAG